MAHLRQQKSIAIDVMGAENGHVEILSGVKLALDEYPEIDSLTLVGSKTILCNESKKLDIFSRVEIEDAPEVVGMDEKPLQSVKKKKNSSIIRGIELVKSKKCDLFLSCGNTGVLMAGSTIKLRPLPLLQKPALASVIPTREHHFVLIDAGANPDSTATQMLHNGILGSSYAKFGLGISNPRVGILTIGTEKGKGNELISKAHELYQKKSHNLNYIGLMEGFQVFENHCDVVVCDGFTGNIVLKVAEGLFGMLKNYVKDELESTLRNRLGAFLSMPAYRNIKKRLNPEIYGGAPLMGLRGYVMKAHGSSNRHHIKNALRISSEVIKHDINRYIIKELESINPNLEVAQAT